MRKWLFILAFGAGLGLAQTTDSHTVTVVIPVVLNLQVDATDFAFDFGATTPGTLTVGSTTYERASLTAYENFLDSASAPVVFAPSGVSGTGGNPYATLAVRSNRAQWTVSLSLSGTLGAPLNNGRLRVFAEKDSGKGNATTSAPTPVPSVTSLITAASNGQGRSVYRVYYLLELDPGDAVGSTGYSGTVTAIYTLTSP